MDIHPIAVHMSAMILLKTFSYCCQIVAYFCRQLCFAWRTSRSLAMWDDFLFSALTGVAAYALQLTL
ncbi:hypothetical protein FKM82_014391 [Ascaphus truei]